MKVLPRAANEADFPSSAAGLKLTRVPPPSLSLRPDPILGSSLSFWRPHSQHRRNPAVPDFHRQILPLPGWAPVAGCPPGGTYNTERSPLKMGEMGDPVHGRAGECGRRQQRFAAASYGMVWLVLMAVELMSLSPRRWQRKRTAKAHRQGLVGLGGDLSAACLIFFSAALPWRQSVSDAASGEFLSACPPEPATGGLDGGESVATFSARVMPARCRCGDWSGHRDRASQSHGISHGDKSFSYRVSLSARSSPGFQVGGLKVPQTWGAARSSRAGSDSANTGDLYWNWPLPWNCCDSPTPGKPARELDGNYGMYL